MYDSASTSYRAAMAMQLDHMILKVNDATTSVDFYTRVLGFTHEGRQGPFSIVRVNDELTLQLAAWQTTAANT